MRPVRRALQRAADRLVMLAIYLVPRLFGRALDEPTEEQARKIAERQRRREQAEQDRYYEGGF
ncbi:hypothetical protein BA062_37615 [Prauserella flavalba]|uniref:Uncharacterized protein n=1 Tax=Prauserella flavalba TaxID=1477506 RepID=A0A318LFX5_9PSEU|nr:hypothetical protein BA062_37615 [Prauserella flavalba]